MHQNLLCILIHILKTPTQPFSSTPYFTAVFLVVFFLVVKSEQFLTELLSMMEIRTP